MERPYTYITVTPKAERSIRAGHPWVYFDEITAQSGEYQNGDIVDVYSEKHRYMGSGYINGNSKIRVRIISTNANDRFDESFYARRIAYAIDYRMTVMGDDFDCCRLIFGEADSFPGFTVDRFGDVLVTEVLSLGIDRIKPMLYRLIVEKLSERGVQIKAIYERNEATLRDKEGLEKYKGFYKADGLCETNGIVRICENGIYYDVDFINGQKTGYFLDQKYNRLAAARLAKGKTVLDCCTHTGAFALNCAKAGAKKVTAVDISEDALSGARHNAELNGLCGNMEFVCADMFDLLTKLSAEGKSEYDYIILDPPAFTKSSATVKSAYRGYKEINMRAMKLLPRGGYLSTCSCSHFMTKELFAKMLADAASDASVRLRQIECRAQCADHPILWGVPETEYLKFYLFQIA